MFSVGRIAAYKPISLTLLDHEVLRRDRLDILIGHRVAESHKLFGRAPIVLEHDQKSFCPSEWSLSLSIPHDVLCSK